MALYDEKLAAIQEQLRRGVVPQRETVRTLLHWFNAERRGFYVVLSIRSKLEKYEIATIPDFDVQYIDGYMEFVKAPSKSESQSEASTLAPDPTYRIGRLDSANNAPLSIKPDATLQEAITSMMNHDYSQLPVMTSPRDVKGMVSWKTIGIRLALKRPCNFVREFMGRAQILSIDSSLFDAISVVAEHDSVLVQAGDKSICGIVTAADFNDQFRRLAEPFLLVGEVENGIRRMLHSKFTTKELEEAKAPGDNGRTISGVTDLTFGEYLKLIEPESKWKKLNLAVDRVEFISRLNKIREVRNDVMHFDPDGLEPSNVSALRDFAKFLRTLREVGAV